MSDFNKGVLFGMITYMILDIIDYLIDKVREKRKKKND